MHHNEQRYAAGRFDLCNFVCGQNAINGTNAFA
jgi:hypothetical protein